MRFKIKNFVLVLLVLVCIVISVCIDIVIYRKEKSKILERHKVEYIDIKYTCTEMIEEIQFNNEGTDTERVVRYSLTNANYSHLDFSTFVPCEVGETYIVQVAKVYRNSNLVSPRFYYINSDFLSEEEFTKNLSNEIIEYCKSDGIISVVVAAVFIEIPVIGGLIWILRDSFAEFHDSIKGKNFEPEEDDEYSYISYDVQKLMDKYDELDEEESEED